MEKCRQAVVGEAINAAVYGSTRHLLYFALRLDQIWATCVFLVQRVLHTSTKQRAKNLTKYLLVCCRIREWWKRLLSDRFQNKQSSGSAKAIFEESNKIKNVQSGGWSFGIEVWYEYWCEHDEDVKVDINVQNIQVDVELKKLINHLHRSSKLSQCAIWILIIVLQQTFSPIRLWCWGREDMVMKIVVVIRILDDTIWEGIRN